MSEEIRFTVMTCPVCATTADVEVRSVIYDAIIVCTGCETKFAVEVDPEKVKVHGHAG